MSLFRPSCLTLTLATDSGADFAAPAGTPVVASNRGHVALVVEFFFGGRLVALDHGEGLYTLYMHLERADVAEGALVERGSIIGAVGSTGRATRPHLHWAAQLRRARRPVSPILERPSGSSSSRWRAWCGSPSSPRSAFFLPAVLGYLRAARHEPACHEPAWRTRAY